MTHPRPESVLRLRGHVSRGPYATGSKSARQAIFLETERGRFVLRRKDGPVYRDAQLRRFVGHTVECDGFFVGTTLLAERIELVE